jgi:hypothetical protein
MSTLAYIIIWMLRGAGVLLMGIALLLVMLLVVSLLISALGLPSGAFGAAVIVGLFLCQF